MKIAIAGAWRWPMYQRACADGLRALGFSVVGFSWEKYFGDWVGKIEAHSFIPLRHIPKLNKELLRFCADERPDVILIWSCMYLYNSTLTRIKKKGILVASYTNDNPFGVRDRSLRYLLGRNIWRKFKKNLPLYDINFVYRKSNIFDYKKIGAKNAFLLLAYYVPERNFCIGQPKSDNFDGIFIGHYENDERAHVITYLRQNGVRIQVHGVGWERSRKKYPGEFERLKPLIDDAYNEKINSARFALCFLSKINGDDYTRRVFEITAAGTLLVAKRTRMMSSLFVDGEEAIFFDSAEEALKRISELLQDRKELERIASNGRSRCLRSGYDVKSRMRELVTVIDTFKEKDGKYST